MVGSPESTNTLGVIPCAISWLFRGINEQKQKTGARFSVRVSAVEVLQQSGGTSQQLKDLLAGHASGKCIYWHDMSVDVYKITDSVCLLPTNESMQTQFQYTYYSQYSDITV
jgi:kinesin family protein 26